MTNDPSRGLSRRRLLQGGTAAAGAAAIGLGVGRAFSYEDDHGSTEQGQPLDSGATGSATVPFYGPHQAGIVTDPQAYAAFVAFDLRDNADRDTLAGIFRVWTQDAARLTQGMGGLADFEPELASEPSRLTVTFGIGPRVFELRGLADHKPSWLKPLPAFAAIDQLQDKWTGGDLLLQICADDALTVSHAARVLSSAVRSQIRPRWTQRGFRRTPGTVAPSATQRNLLGQIDGTVNPDPQDADFEDVIFSAKEGPSWFHGGSSLVLRRIRFELDKWEELDRRSRELTIGRTLSNGAPLTGKNENDPADFSEVDDTGLQIIPPESHMARARPQRPGERILRRPYNYDIDPEGDEISESGLLFTSYQADPIRQYLPIQRRLAEKDALNTWTIPIGSAVFALPPGTQEGEFIGQALFES